MPAVEISVAVIAKLMLELLIKFEDRADVPQFAEHPEAKLEPAMVAVKPELPAVVLEGESELIDGVLCVVELEGVEEDPPPPQFIVGSAKALIQTKNKKRTHGFGWDGPLHLCRFFIENYHRRKFWKKKRDLKLWPVLPLVVAGLCAKDYDVCIRAGDITPSHCHGRFRRAAIG